MVLLVLTRAFTHAVVPMDIGEHLQVMKCALWQSCYKMLFNFKLRIAFLLLTWIFLKPETSV